MIKAPLFAFLTGRFPYSPELQAFFMAFQGCMAVRSGRNRNKTMNWFHAFMLSVFTGYSGAAFAFLWIGKPTSLLGNDLNMASCVLSFIIVNYLPLDAGYRLGKTRPITIITTLFAQLFRVLGVIKFTDMGFEVFRSKPSEYYPIPIVGPILLATILGNMGGFFLNGFDKYLEKGMPWPFQNGLFCASFHHFYVNDKTGFIGIALRNFVDLLLPKSIKMNFTDQDFSIICVSVFMHVVCLLQLPFVLGPSFSPFVSVLNTFSLSSSEPKIVTNKTDAKDKKEN